MGGGGGGEGMGMDGLRMIPHRPVQVSIVRPRRFSKTFAGGGGGGVEVLQSLAMQGDKHINV